MTVPSIRKRQPPGKDLEVTLSPADLTSLNDAVANGGTTTETRPTSATRVPAQNEHRCRSSEYLSARVKILEEKNAAREKEARELKAAWDAQMDAVKAEMKGMRYVER